MCRLSVQYDCETLDEGEDVLHVLGLLTKELCCFVVRCGQDKEEGIKHFIPFLRQFLDLVSHSDASQKLSHIWAETHEFLSRSAM